MKTVLSYVLRKYVRQILKPGEVVTRCGSYRISSRYKKYMVYITNLRIILVRRLGLLHCRLEAYPRKAADYAIKPCGSQTQQ